jgi:hypothetical protein
MYLPAQRAAIFLIGRLSAGENALDSRLRGNDGVFCVSA